MVDCCSREVGRAAGVSGSVRARSAKQWAQIIGDLAVAPRGRGPCAGQGPRQPDLSVVTAIDALAGGCAGSFAHRPPPATKGLQKCGQSRSTDVQDGLGETSLTEGAIAQEDPRNHF